MFRTKQRLCATNFAVVCAISLESATPGELVCQVVSSGGPNKGVLAHRIQTNLRRNRIMRIATFVTAAIVAASLQTAAFGAIWTAYNDTVFTSAGNVTNYSGYLGGGAVLKHPLVCSRTIAPDYSRP